jgi:hypothetical protein
MLKWGHLATFLVIMGSLVMKKYHMYNRAQILLVLALPFSYGYPLTYSIYIYKYTQPQMIDSLHMTNLIPSNHSNILYIEVNYFFTWLASICIVLMYFYLRKFRSPYNPEHLSG